MHIFEKDYVTLHPCYRPLMVRKLKENVLFIYFILINIIYKYHTKHQLKWCKSWQSKIFAAWYYSLLPLRANFTSCISNTSKKYYCVFLYIPCEYTTPFRVRLQQQEYIKAQMKISTIIAMRLVTMLNILLKDLSKLSLKQTLPKNNLVFCK